MDIKHAVPSALPSSWTILQAVNMKDHGRKSSWTNLSPYLRGLKIKNLIPAPKSPKSLSPESPRTLPEDSTFQIVHTPDRPDRPISKTAIPSDEQCMEFLMALQRQEEHKRGGVKTGLKIWPYPEEEEEVEDRRYLRSVRVESVHFEEARLARTNSSGPARVVDVHRSSTKSTTATQRSDCTSISSDSEDDDLYDVVDEVPKITVRISPLSPPPTLPRHQSPLELHTLRADTSRWSDDSLESRFSARDIDSPCPQRGSPHSPVEASSPTVFDDDDAAGPSTPPPMTPATDRPVTPFTDPRLSTTADPFTPPPSNHIAHHMSISPEPAPRKYSWRSSKDTILNTGAPISRFQSWLPEPQSKEVEAQQSEPEVYGDWADYYFEDDNFWKGKGPIYDEEGDETRVEEDDADADDERNEDEIDEVDEEHDQVDLPLAGDGKFYLRYERFVRDYKDNVMNAKVMGV